MGRTKQRQSKTAAREEPNDQHPHLPKIIESSMSSEELPVVPRQRKQKRSPSPISSSTQYYSYHEEEEEEEEEDDDQQDRHPYPKLRATALGLTVIILALTVWASVSGLVVGNVYWREANARTQHVWQANDAVTLGVVVPLLGCTLQALFLLPHRTNSRPTLAWMSLLLYIMTNSLFYVMTTVPNECFLVHVALVALSIYTLLLVGLSCLGRVRGRGPIWVSGYVVGLTLALIFLRLVLYLTDDGPQSQLSPHPNGHAVLALDLIVVQPPLFLAGIGSLLWRRKHSRIGFVATTVWLGVHGLHTLKWSVGAYWVPRQNPALLLDESLNLEAQLYLWSSLTVASALAYAALLSKVKERAE